VSFDCWILFGACLAGNGSYSRGQATVGENRQHRGIRSSALEEDSDPLAWFHRSAVANDPSSLIKRDTVAARQYGAGVEVRETGRQPREVSTLALRSLLPRTAQPRRQRFDLTSAGRRLWASQQQSTAQAGQRRPCPGAGLQ